MKLITTSSIVLATLLVGCGGTKESSSQPTNESITIQEESNNTKVVIPVALEPIVEINTTKEVDKTTIVQREKKIITKYSTIEIPTLVVVVNSLEKKETAPGTFNNLIFNEVSSYILSDTANKYKFIPAKEEQGKKDDGVIFINTDESHFSNATTSSEYLGKMRTVLEKVDNYIDFSKYAKGKKLSPLELHIIFLIAGGDSTLGDGVNSISARSTRLNTEIFTYDGVSLFEKGGLTTASTRQRGNISTKGTIIHESYHSLFGLADLYSNNGKGIGVYDMMANGNWSYISSSKLGDSPVGLSAPMQFETKILTYDKVFYSNNIIDTVVELKCSDNEAIRIINSSNNSEQFMIDCTNPNSKKDLSFSRTYGFGYDFFTTIYRYDSSKKDNNEDGIQDYNNHFRVGLVQNNNRNGLATKKSTLPSTLDNYYNGDIISSDKLNFYSGSSDFNIEVVGTNKSNGTMTIRIY